MLTNQNFSKALEALNQYKRVTRSSGIVNQSLDATNFIFKRPPRRLEIGFIINVDNSMPQSVKDFFKGLLSKLNQSEIDHYYQMPIVSNAHFCRFNGKTIEIGWQPNQADLLAEDWCILE